MLKGVEALLLDNSKVKGIKGESLSVKIYRVSKTSRARSPHLIYEITGSDTAKGKFEQFTSKAQVTRDIETVDNDSFIYYAEISYCKECDFTEVKFITF